MDADLEKAILRTLSESLSQLNPIQEAKGDWTTTREVICKIRAFAPFQNPLINLNAYVPPTSGERRHYQSMLKQHISSNYFKKYERKHFAALQAGERYSRDVLTRGRLTELLGDHPLPKELRDKWATEYREELDNVRAAIKRKLSAITAELIAHNNSCRRPCIMRTKLGPAVKRGEHVLLDVLQGRASPEDPTSPGQRVRMWAKVARDAVSLADRETMTNEKVIQCSPSGAEYLNNAAYLLDARSDELDMDLADLIDKQFYLAQENHVKPLDAAEFQYLRNNPKIGAALMRADQVDIKEPLVTARSTKLEHQIIWQIIKYSKIRKFDKDTDLCAELAPIIQKISDEHDYEDPEGFFEIYIARQLSSHHGYDRIKEAFENVIGNWSNSCADFLSATRPQYQIPKKGNAVAGIAPMYAVPGSEEHTDFRDTGKVPRIKNDQGIGIGGQFGAEQPTVYEVYNNFLDKEIPKEYGFTSDFTWLVIFGTEESALLDNEDGTCPVCQGDGFVTQDTVGIPTGGGLDPDYWGVSLGDYQGACSNCEGSGRCYPRVWQHVEEEGDFTPFELAFREIWSLLQKYNPVAYDGFITNQNKLVTNDGYPIPAPARPEVETQYKQGREGEANTMAYTTIIRLDKPLRGQETSVGEHFQSDFFQELRDSFASLRMPTDMTPVTGSESEQEILVYSLRREPNWAVKRWSRERTDARNHPSRAEASRVSDIEEFEQEYFRIVSDGVHAEVPSHQLLGELEKLLSVARELDAHRLYDITVPIYAFLEMDREEYGGRSSTIGNYDDLVEKGQESSYGDLLEYLLNRLNAHKDKLKSYERYSRVLTDLWAKSSLYNIEMPGSNSTELSKVTDVGEELKLYMNFKNRVKRLQRVTIFKPNTRGDAVTIKGIDDIEAISRRINQVFQITQPKQSETGVPLNSPENPVFQLLVPLGWEDLAEGIAGIDEMKIVEHLITGGGFDVQPRFESHDARKALARIYWKAQIENEPLFKVLEQEIGEADYLDIRDMWPNYGVVHSLSKQFENNNSKNPEYALTEMFAKGVELTAKLFDDNREALSQVYGKIKATPEGDLEKLNTFLKAARHRLLSPAIKARMYRDNRRAKDHYPAVQEAERDLRENQEWKSRYNDILGDFFDLDEEDIDEEDLPQYHESRLFKVFSQLVQGAAQLLPKYGQFAQLIRNSPASFVREAAPIFEQYLSKNGINIDLHNVIYPGVDAQEEIENALDLLESLKMQMGFQREGGKIRIDGPKRKLREFYRRLLEDAKDTGEDL